MYFVILLWKQVLIFLFFSCKVACSIWAMCYNWVGFPCSIKIPTIIYKNIWGGSEGKWGRRFGWLFCSLLFGIQWIRRFFKKRIFIWKWYWKILFLLPRNGPKTGWHAFMLYCMTGQYMYVVGFYFLWR